MICNNKGTYVKRDFLLFLSLDLLLLFLTWLQGLDRLIWPNWLVFALRVCLDYLYVSVRSFHRLNNLSNGLLDLFEVEFYYLSWRRLLGSKSRDAVNFVDFTVVHFPSKDFVDQASLLILLCLLSFQLLLCKLWLRLILPSLKLSRRALFALV